MVKNIELEKLLFSVDIIDLVSGYTDLKKSGQDSFVGKCLFHDDNRPSMSVSRSKGIYKCFSCGAGGNSIGFVMEMENLSFRKAVEKLIKDYKLDINIDHCSTGEPFDEDRRLLLDLSEDVHKFYDYILRETNSGTEAQGYLASRDIIGEDIKRFDIGLSLDLDSQLFNTFTEKGHPKFALVNIGLVIETENGYIDTFRDRLLFGIRDLNGDLIGYSGRIYKKGDIRAKYVNTRGTELFAKGNILYNLNHAKKHCKIDKTLILCEGIGDIIALENIEIRYGVASLGTSLTMRQARLLRDNCDKVIIAYDGDSAGQLATVKAIKILKKFDIIVEVLCLPIGQDVDDIVSKQGKEEFYKLYDNKITSKDFIERFNKERGK